MQKHGAVPMQLIREMLAAGYIRNANHGHIQPASLDLTLSDECFRLRGSYLPRSGETVSSLLKSGAMYKHSLDRPLEMDGIYLVRLNETLHLPEDIHANASNKSSSGRINLRGRLLADNVPRFDDIPAGYHGSLWLEVSPKSFPVLVHPGDRINQIRFFHGDARLSPLEHRIAFDRFHLLRGPGGEPITDANAHVARGITMTVDLSTHETVGWQARRTAWNVLDTAKFDHDPHDFFEPVRRPATGEIILHPQAFFILATKERVITPPDFATEMAAYDSSKGEFRSHFAGFFDPGWGWADDATKRGTIAVLEIEAYSHDFVLRDGQPICLMVYEHMLEAPEKLYGAELNSHYSFQTGPRLAKWFK